MAFNQAGQKRAGNPHVEATGHPAPAGQKPMTTKSKGFGSDSHRRMGDNHVPATGHPGVAGECPVTSGN